MTLESGVIAKIAAAVGLAGVSSAGVYYGHSYFTPGKNLLSKYDRALIDFLDKDGQDIAFEIKTGDPSTAEFGVSNLTFANSSNSVKAKVQVSVSTTGTENDAFKGTSSLPSVPNHTQNWTWSCELTFSKVEGANTATTIQNNDRIMSSASKGLFHILKKDTTTADTAEDLKREVKEAKVNFIKQCAKARGPEKNLKLDTENYSADNNSPSSTVTFTFNGESGESPTQLIPQNQREFNDWFRENYSTKP